MIVFVTKVLMPKQIDCSSSRFLPLSIFSGELGTRGFLVEILNAKLLSLSILGELLLLKPMAGSRNDLFDWRIL
ncbi:hypothetical protein MA16_Dca012642 [Dendrobium catenatum]|uniref:Uncharacterized protein n=1 Tax=Dendrobium catenatum TaxID=906689 RepID=A0A2I0VMZ8_9ASPA|nr:hypothetical protein MA16_Dca012642 [Dendrobium catenatum]